MSNRTRNILNTITIVCQLFTLWCLWWMNAANKETARLWREVYESQRAVIERQEQQPDR